MPANPLVAAARRHGRGSVANPVDGVHLQPRGEMVFARTIFARLDKLGWIPRPRAAAKKEGSNE
jgi:lysophospholipase L1-like esterase